MARPLFRFRALPADAAPAAAPDIGAIEASLRNCSIARRHGRGYGHHHHHRRPVLGSGAGAADGRGQDDITVELNSEVPLPGNWEQILNIQTGEIHYINRADGTKTNRDPRPQGCYAAPHTSAVESDPESLVYDADANDTSSDDNTSYYTTSTSDSSGHDHRSNCESLKSSPSSSTLSTATTVSSTASSAESSAAESPEVAAVLVLVGCRLCLTLSMVPRRGEECPKCGGSLLLRF